MHVAVRDIRSTILGFLLGMRVAWQAAMKKGGLMADQTSNDNVNINELINEAEQRFRKGMSMLNDWGSQARQVIDRQPAAVLAGVAVLGFVTGLLLRRAVVDEDR